MRSLSTINTSITSVVYEFGFDSPQYFVRLFKNKTDMTSTRFRDSIH
ncbi:AraC family transcriptional regulator [Thalassotalea piscium]